MKTSKGSRLHASVLLAIIVSSAGAVAFTPIAANAIAVPESVQETFPPGGNGTQIQEQLSPVEQEIVDHITMARQALVNGNLTLAVEELITAMELQTGTSSDIGLGENSAQQQSSSGLTNRTSTNGTTAMQ